MKTDMTVTIDLMICAIFSTVILLTIYRRWTREPPDLPITYFPLGLRVLITVPFSVFFRKIPVRIVNTSYPSVRPGTSSEENSRSGIDCVAGTIKCRIHGLKGMRKIGTNLDRDDVTVGCDGKSMKRHRGCRHRRQRRRRVGKVLFLKPFIQHNCRSLPFSSPAFSLSVMSVKRLSLSMFEPLVLALFPLLGVLRFIVPR